MPVQSPTFFIPASVGLGTGGKHPYETTMTPPFLLEDIYFRGGFRCLPSIEIRDKLPISACKVGMLVYTPETGGNIWKLETIVGNTVTWSLLSLGGGGDYTGIDPIGVSPDSEIYIDHLRILPKLYDTDGEPLATQGNVVSLDENLIPIWKDASSSGMTGIREYKVHTTPILDALDAPIEDFILELGKFVALISVTVDIPDVLVEAYSTAEMYEQNPYKFISTETLLSDTGISEDAMNNWVRQRRYSFISNLDTPVSNKTYWRIKYLADTEASKDSDGAVIRYRQVTLSLCYLTLEA